MLAACLALVVLATACGREVPPDQVALEYARALYGRDLSRAYRLLSSRDREWKTEAGFVAEGDAPTGNALELSRHLASFIEVASAERKITGDRAEVTLTLRLPNANAPEVAGLVQDWDEAALNALSEQEAERIRTDLAALHRSGRLPTLEGKETFELVKEASGWRLILHMAGAVRIRFTARIPEGFPLQVDPREQELRVRPGEPVQVSLRLRSGSGRDVSVRVSHVIEPEDAAPFLVFLQCPLLLPLTLLPGESKEILSSFMIAGNAPASMQEFRLTFAFRRAD
jgi:hypothetical protein